MPVNGLPKHLLLKFIFMHFLIPLAFNIIWRSSFSHSNTMTSCMYRHQYLLATSLALTVIMAAKNKEGQITPNFGGPPQNVIENNEAENWELLLPLTLTWTLPSINPWLADDWVSVASGTATGGLMLTGPAKVFITHHSHNVVTNTTTVCCRTV